MEPLIITKEQVAELLPMQECIAVMEKAFLDLSENKCLQPLRSTMKLPDKKGLLGMMPSFSQGLGMMGIKVISIFPGNGEFGFQSHQGSMMLFEAKNGKLLCIIDAGEITKIRTAAVSALATKFLARKEINTLAILGSGEQASSHIEAMMLVRKIKTLKLWSRNAEHAKQLAGEVSQKQSVNIIVTATERECIENADLICTVTASVQPILKGAWLHEGAHINAVGSCTPQTREWDTNAILKSKLYTDCYESLFHEAGDFIIPKAEGVIDDSHVKGELAEIISGKKPGREKDDEITLFKSLGIGIEDLYAANHIYQKMAAH